MAMHVLGGIRLGAEVLGGAIILSGMIGAVNICYSDASTTDLSLGKRAAMGAMVGMCRVPILLGTQIIGLDNGNIAFRRNDSSSNTFSIMDADLKKE